MKDKIYLEKIIQHILHKPDKEHLQKIHVQSIHRTAHFLHRLQ